jgi:zinc protease
MTTAWLHSGGVCQMFGYTVVTFYGYMGWGTGMLFDEGRLSLSEAFFLNNQALLHQLATRAPQLLMAMPASYGDQDIQRFAEHFVKGGGRDELGLLWDRDTVAFYGDPAWVARYPPRASAVNYRLEEDKGLWSLVVTSLKDGPGDDPKGGSRPLMILLPERLGGIRDVTCDAPVQPVVTERFILRPLSGKDSMGTTVRVTFKAQVEPVQK